MRSRAILHRPSRPGSYAGSVSSAHPAAVRPFSGIRQPRWFRVCAVAFGTVWCGYLVVLTIVGLVNGIPAALVALLPAALGGWYVSRFFRIAVAVKGDELVVRNRWRTYRIRRQDIEGFWIGPSSELPWAEVINVRMPGGQAVSLRVTARLRLSDRSRARLEQHLEDLGVWAGLR